MKKSIILCLCLITALCLVPPLAADARAPKAGHAEPAALNPQQEATSSYVNTIITSTPNPDGSIIHIVKEGETLWAIAMAYGLTGAEIMANSGNSPLATDVYAGQILIIRLADPATPTLTLTPTPTRITPQPTSPRPSLTPVPTHTPLPTPTETPVPSLFYRVFADGKTVGLALAGISAAGILLVLVFGFLKKER
ncbi:MAG: LysM peptidoglycan-binding domain-containing protein [Chloroflexi bacterium]|jgi:LysM repeat protein|nr:LysM peptidoglycan-binding domain-containing protein [Anaerolineaceae bacterium]NLI45300.1 LysM peptidoglycan-binding domain-containing protein [Chloroflexota bacterium]HOE35609.1 LysM peptidoglycan-binding domain-containing protein [Anaerolineaceae bacterium]HOT25260.1 LysM peptidoglycan-binding domain-containing protein [Anaerolineaceae bacterium]HQH57800.1 LysM peptidoglycan-binding domain-containing protein [Anaerolineaceae bacterium]